MAVNAALPTRPRQAEARPVIDQPIQQDKAPTPPPPPPPVPQVNTLGQTIGGTINTSA